MIDEYTGEKIISPLDLPLDGREEEIYLIKESLTEIDSSLDRMSENLAQMRKIVERMIENESISDINLDSFHADFRA